MSAVTWVIGVTIYTRVSEPGTSSWCNGALPEASNAWRNRAMPVSTLLIIVLLVVLIGALPTWPHSRSWGYYPSGGLGLILLIVVVLLLMGRI